MGRVISKFFYLLFIISALNADVKALSNDELQVWMKNGIKVIDVRRQEEWSDTGIIPGSYRLTFYNKKNEANLRKWLYIFARLVKTKNTAFVLVCDTSERSKKIANILSKNKKYKNVFYLDEGIISWIDEEYRVLKYN